jgi:hypothetical protein
LLAQQLDALARSEDQSQAELRALAVKTRQQLARLETLVGEAARERRSKLADTPDPEPLSRTLMRVRHDVVMLRRAMREGVDQALGEQIAQGWTRAVTTGATALRDVAEALSNGRAPQQSDAVSAAVGDYCPSLDEAARREPLPADAAWRLFSAGFALDQFRRDLADLRERAHEFAAGRKPGASG